MIKNSMQTKVIYLALNASCCFTLNVSGGWWCFRTLRCKNNCRQQCRKHCTYRKTPDSACPIESVRLHWDALGYISTSKDFNVPQKPCRISRKAATQPIFQKACGSQQRCSLTEVFHSRLRKLCGTSLHRPGCIGIANECATHLNRASTSE